MEVLKLLTLQQTINNGIQIDIVLFCHCDCVMNLVLAIDQFCIYNGFSSGPQFVVIGRDDPGWVNQTDPDPSLRDVTTTRLGAHPSIHPTDPNPPLPRQDPTCRVKSYRLNQTPEQKRELTYTYTGLSDVAPNLSLRPLRFLVVRFSRRRSD